MKKSFTVMAALLAVFSMLFMGCPGEVPNEEVATVATPVISDVTDNVVTITTATAGAVIHYTTDGTAPTASSTAYSAAITLTATVTVKAIAVKSGMTTSAVATKACTYTAPAEPIYILDEATLTKQAGASYGQVVVFNDSENPIAVTEGDWIVFSTTVAFSNIGQTYAGIGFTAEGTTSATYPNIAGGPYTTEAGTNSYNYFEVYKVPSDGSIHYISWNNNDNTMTALALGTDVVFTNLKVVRFAKADIDSTTKKIAEAATATMTAVTSGTAVDYQYSPTISEVSAAAGEIVVGMFTRPAIAQGYKGHYLNSGLGWMDTYPSNSAGTVKIYKTVTETKTTNWFQVGIKDQAPTVGATLECTNMEVRILPAL